MPSPALRRTWTRALRRSSHGLGRRSWPSTPWSLCGPTPNEGDRSRRCRSRRMPRPMPHRVSQGRQARFDKAGGAAVGRRTGASWRHSAGLAKTRVVGSSGDPRSGWSGFDPKRPFDLALVDPFQRHFESPQFVRDRRNGKGDAGTLSAMNGHRSCGGGDLFLARLWPIPIRLGLRSARGYGPRRISLRSRLIP